MTTPNKVGFVLAALTGGWHLFWSLLVLFGWAQPFIDFIFWIHMLRSIYVVKPFDPMAAVSLVLVTSFFGYITGYIGAVIWRHLHRDSKYENLTNLHITQI